MAAIKAIIPEARHMQMGQKPFCSYIIALGGVGITFWEYQGVPPPERGST